MLQRILVLLLWLPIVVACGNTDKEINDFLADKNLPTGNAENMVHVYKESGIITSKLYTPLFLDYSNRTNHPYSEFPKGIKIVTIDKNTKDSVTVTGDYAITYSKASMSSIKGNVKVINHKEKILLTTRQLYWDQAENYFFTDSPFLLKTPFDEVKGNGFESDSKLKNWIINNTQGTVSVQN